MWTREPSFDTSRKVEPAKRVAALALSCALLVSGCLVVDVIEFSDAVNTPLEVRAALPATALVAACPSDTLEFTVVVWEPDERTMEELEMRGRMVLELSPSANGAGQCALPVLSAADELRETGEAGMLLEITCSINLAGLAIHEESLYPVELTISDAGFTPAGNPRQSARTATASWVLQVVATGGDSSCSG